MAELQVINLNIQTNYTNGASGGLYFEELFGCSK